MIVPRNSYQFINLYDSKSITCKYIAAQQLVEYKDRTLSPDFEPCTKKKQQKEIKCFLRISFIRFSHNPLPHVHTHIPIIVSDFMAEKLEVIGFCEMTNLPHF